MKKLILILLIGISCTGYSQIIKKDTIAQNGTTIVELRHLFNDIVFTLDYIQFSNGKEIWAITDTSQNLVFTPKNENYRIYMEDTLWYNGQPYPIDSMFHEIIDSQDINRLRIMNQTLIDERK